MMTTRSMELDGDRERARASSRTGSALKGTGLRIVAAYRLGGRTMLAAPVIAAVAILPELAQHVVEIKLGMFASIDAFRALADDPARWAFGYAKLAGFWLAILATARFWAVEGDVARAIRPGWSAAGRLSAGIGLAVLQSLLMKAVAGHGVVIDTVASLLSLLLQCSLFVYLVGSLLGDERATLRWSFTAGWPRALFMTLLLALTFAPCQMLHMAGHRLAIGSPVPVVWGVMLLDGLFVGLFAALAGSAMVVGYRFGPSWRGWDGPLTGWGIRRSAHRRDDARPLRCGRPRSGFR